MYKFILTYINCFNNLFVKIDLDSWSNTSSNFVYTKTATNPKDKYFSKHAAQQADVDNLIRKCNLVLVSDARYLSSNWTPFASIDDEGSNPWNSISMRYLKKVSLSCSVMLPLCPCEFLRFMQEVPFSWNDKREQSN